MESLLRNFLIRSGTQAQRQCRQNCWKLRKNRCVSLGGSAYNSNAFWDFNGFVEDNSKILFEIQFDWIISVSSHAFSWTVECFELGNSEMLQLHSYSAVSAFLLKHGKYRQLVCKFVHKLLQQFYPWRKKFKLWKLKLNLVYKLIKKKKKKKKQENSESVFGECRGFPL